MFDNRHHFGWKPENSQQWASQVANAKVVNKTPKHIPTHTHAPFISEHEITLNTKYPACAPLDPFGRDD